MRVSDLIRRLLLTMAIATCATPASAFDSTRLDFAVRFGDEVSRYRVLGLYLLPGETITLEAKPERAGGGDFELLSDGRPVAAMAPRRWRFTAPADGLHRLELCRNAGGCMLLNVFVLVPAERIEGEYLLGYRLGLYPSSPLRGLSIYRRPRGFIAVTPELLSVHVAPHFTLGQFVCKQQSDYPKIVTLRERLLLKLEMILRELNDRGISAESFNVLSGYRTPYYNHVIGNVKYSRHIYGDAADIFVDENGDDMMDDLNRDGRSDYRDADILRNLVESLYGSSAYEPYVGGLGRYRARPGVRGPFVHVDTRGFRARWEG